MTVEKAVHWIGSSKRHYLAFPDPVKSELGYALGVAQLGGKHPRAKPWKGDGPGVFELVESFDGNAYRAIYALRWEDASEGRHVVQKKSPSGVRTASPDVELVAARLRLARADHETRT